jgi:hypothetical protein
MTGWLAVRVIVGLVALGVGFHLTRWRRRSRAQWREYDEAYGDPRPTRASARAKRLPRRD